MKLTMRGCKELEERDEEMAIDKKESTPKVIHAADEAIMKMALKGTEKYDKTLSKLAKN
ncbi:hypothetical protein [Paenibacillus sp. FSL A5-0031]|uniref:hypothetical protein n=1 Tax=Paenibacillus sp. FSL A5-0031 TaxID=1920420 RepID=UPI0015C37D2B|nr:hypothetical protein [Paenibacillus sp. FSL A5-0031]